MNLDLKISAAFLRHKSIGRAAAFDGGNPAITAFSHDPAGFAAGNTVAEIVIIVIQPVTGTITVANTVATAMDWVITVFAIGGKAAHADSDIDFGFGDLR